jgi:hypothetical protein
MLKTCYAAERLPSPASEAQWEKGQGMRAKKASVKSPLLISPGGGKEYAVFKIAVVFQVLYIYRRSSFVQHFISSCRRGEWILSS